MLLHKITSGHCLALTFLFFGFQYGVCQKISHSETLRSNGRSFTHVKRVNLEKSATCDSSIFRSVDGTCNNTTDPSRYEWGASDIILMREMDSDFGASDPFNAMNGEERQSPRAISNALCAQEGDVPNQRNLSSMVFTWGQFVDHDIDLTPEGHTEYEPIILPEDEPLFTSDIPFFRSEVEVGTGEIIAREQRNLITSWIDASNIYGSDMARANWLRTFENGKLKSSSGDLLPFNTVDGEYESALDPSAPGMAGDTDREGNGVKTFASGDVRAAEQPGLTSLHTLFMREHNRICDLLTDQDFTDDEEMYQIARKWVGAIIQSITYSEFLPALGIEMGSYRGYDDDIQPDIFNMFATVAYRLGHTMVSDELILIDAQCRDDGSVGLMESFFNPDVLREHNIGRILNGLNKQIQEEVDLQIIDNLRNFLFGDPSAEFVFGLDLASLNIQRARDHGMPDYNTIRAHFLGQKANRFRDITRSGDRQNALREAYGSVDNIDAWIGMLAEDQVHGSSLGPTLKAILEVQFGRLRDCDYFYFEKDEFFNSGHIDMIKNARLADIILMNTNLNKLGTNVFFQASCESSNYNGKELNPIFNSTEEDDNNGDGNGGGDGNHHGNGHNNGNGNHDGGGHGHRDNDQGNNSNSGNNNGNNGDNSIEQNNANTGAAAFSQWAPQIGILEDEVVIGPNPTTDFIDIKISLREAVQNASIQLTDLLGQEMFKMENAFSGNNFSERLNLSFLPPGIYFFNVLSSDERLLQSEKIIVGR